MRKYVFLMFILLSLAACASNQQSQVNDGSVELGLAQTDDSSETITPVSQEPAQNQMGGIGQGMGRSGGMMARHYATVPETYVSVVNPGSDEESLARGAEIYAAHCAVCHGDGGMGDGVAAKGFDPAPAAVAHTSQMLGDDYLFWRISDGGAAEPFSSAMPAWKNVLAEDARWDVINYVRALGAGTVMPGRGMGGMRYDPDGELQMRTMMLATAVSQNLITQAEADTFNKVHSAMDQLTPDGQMRGNMNIRENKMLNQLLASGEISQAEMEEFNRIHDLLVSAELMQ